MAQAAAVYTTAPFLRTAEDIIRDLGPLGASRPTRPRPEGKRVWASLTQEPDEVIESAFLDASSRDPKQKKQWVVLVDGNADQLRRVRLAAKRLRVTVTIVLDLSTCSNTSGRRPVSFTPRGRQTRRPG